MSKAAWRTAQPRGIARFLLRLPIGLYRVGLGRLLGSRFLMLEHVGRRSGLKHRTVLEVVDHDRSQGNFIVASGWGRRADWFQNVVHNPAVTVWAGRAAFDAKAQVLGPEAALAAIQEYARRTPLAFRMLTRLFLGETEEDPERLCRRMADEIPLMLLARAPSAEP